MHLWRVSSVSSAPLLEPEDDDVGGVDDADGGDGAGYGGGGGGGGGSKGEAADIRVSLCFERTKDARSSCATFHMRVYAQFLRCQPRLGIDPCPPIFFSCFFSLAR